MLQETPKDKKLVMSKKAKDAIKMFSGSADLVRGGNTEDGKLLLLVAKVFDLPATCVNIMGGLPYINKDGLLYKLNEYENANIVSLQSKIIQLAGKAGERAIIESTLILKDKNGKERIFNAIGEADNASVKLEAVRATPNMMAETRSVNRVIGKAIKARMLKDMYVALGRAKGVGDDERMVIQSAIQTTAEEMNVSPSKLPVVKMSKDTVIKQLLEKINAENNQSLLSEYYQKITTSMSFEIGEKSILIKAIANRRKFLNAKDN